MKFIKRHLIPILLIVLVIPTFISLMRPGFFPMQDDLQAFRIYEMDKCFQDFQIPCRWVPDMGYGYGYPQFNFYSPGVFYLGEMIHLLGFQFIDSVKILFGLGFILAALTMFVFLKSFFGEVPALFGSLLYSYAPFKAAEVYVRGSISEFWAFVFFPLIFWSSYQLIKTEKSKYLVWFAVSTALLLVTHNLMSLIFIPVAAVWILTLLIIERKNMVTKFLSGGFLALGLSAFFVLPVLFEKQFVHVESILSGYFDYRQHFVNLYQLFISNYFGYGSSVLGNGDEVTLSTGLVHWILGVLGLILAVLNFKKLKGVSLTMIVLGVITLLVLFLTHQKSSFIWSSIPVLVWLQFPWRFLSLSVFLLSILGAGGIYFLIQMNRKKIALLVGSLAVVLILLLHGPNFTPSKWLDISDKDKFSGVSWEKQLTISIFDYLPIYAKLPPNHVAPNEPEILEGSVAIFNYTKRSNYQFGEVNAYDKALVRLPLLDFPGMEVLIDGKKAEHFNDICWYEPYCFGLISFLLEPGHHNITAKLNNTPIRTLGNLLTVLSFIILLWMIVKLRMKHA